MGLRPKHADEPAQYETPEESERRPRGDETGDEAHPDSSNAHDPQRLQRRMPLPVGDDGHICDPLRALSEGTSTRFAHRCPYVVAVLAPTTPPGDALSLDLERFSHRI